MADVNIAIKLVNNLEISKNDDRIYRAFTLDNGLKCIVVSDPTTEQSAASVEVSVGQFSDPEILPGLAHFLEHMLFLGTEKYPDENSYSAYLNEYGGYSNAYTASEATNYHFCVANNGLKEALDRFSSFFICPLFTETATGRELQAVDSEHKKNLQQDMWRSYQLDKSTSHPLHPYHKFGTGDSRTLRDIPSSKGIDVRSALLAFHKEHYSSSRMSLAIYGAESVDTLELWAREYFTAITNNHSQAPVFNGHPYNGPGTVTPSPFSADGKRYNGLVQYVVPVKDSRTLNISWALPEQKSDWKSKCGRYLSHILGHEGPGTILSHLKARGWATELYAGTDSSDSGFSIFSVTVELSDDGFAHVDEVQMIIYAYLGVLQAHGPQKWIFDEEALQAVQTFRFIAKGQPFHYVTQLTGALQDYPTEQTVSGNYLFWEWNPKNVEYYLSFFTPENARVRVLAKSLQGEKTPLREPWYNTEYGEEILSDDVCQRYRTVTATYKSVITQLLQTQSNQPVTSETTKTDDQPSPLPSFRTATVTDLTHAVQNLQPRLTLPAPNDFLASDFEIRHPSLKDAQLQPNAPPRSPCAKTVNEVRVRREPIPSLVRNDNRCEIWHHCDDFFAVPKLYAYIQLHLANSYNSPRASVLMELYIRLIKEALTDYAYAASVAGLNSDANSTVQGANFFFYGFSHKLARLVARAGEKTANLTFSDMLFDVQKDKYEKQLENWAKESPYRHAVQRVTLAMSYPVWTPTEKITAIKSLTANDLRAFIPEFLRTVYVRMLVSGNGTRDEALAVADAFTAPLITKSVPPVVSEFVNTRIVQLPAPVTLQHADNSSTLVNFEFLYSIPAPNPADPNGAMEMTLQIGEGSVGALGGLRNAYTELAGHILSEPYFDVLRTQQQLGYIVNASVKHDQNIQALRFIVQSGKVDPPELIARTDAFLTAYVRTLEEMPADKFTANVRAVAIKRSEADKNLGYEANRLWEEILTTLEFTRASNDVDALFQIKQNEFVEWYRQHIAPGGNARRAFAALVEKGTAPADGTTEEGDAEGVEGGEEEETVTPTESKTEASTEEAKKAPTVVIPPLPVVDISLADAGVVLHALRVLAKSSVAWTEFTAIVETGIPNAPEFLTNIQKAMDTNKTAIRIRIIVPAEDSSPSVIRSILPAYPDNGSIYRNACIRKLTKSTTTTSSSTA